MKTAELGPLGDDDVAVLIDGAAVGRVDDAGFPFGLGKAVVGAVFFVNLVAELSGDVAGFVQEGDAALEFGKERVIATDVDGRGHAEVFLDDADEVAFEVPMFDAIVVAIANEEILVARIVGDAVAGFEFPFGFARAAEGFHEFTVFVELEDVVGPVTIGDEDGAICGDGDGAGVETVGVFKKAGFLWVVESPDVFAGEGELDDFVGGRPSGVNEFRAVFVADFESVNVAGADSALKLASGVVDENAARRIGGDVNVAGFVDGGATVAGADGLAAGSCFEMVGDVVELEFVFGRGEGEGGEEGADNRNERTWCHADS